MTSTTPADVLQPLTQQKMEIYEVQRELQGTGTFLTNVNQEQVEDRGLQPEPLKYEAAFKVSSHPFTLTQQRRDCCRCLKCSKMTHWYSNTGTAAPLGCCIVHSSHHF